MTTNTKIEWADHTFNPWWGCAKVSPACDHCYAAALDKRTGGDHWGPGHPRRRTGESNWNNPMRWNKRAAKFFAVHGRRQRVFCASMADVFDNEVDPQWRSDLFALIAATPNLDWLILTKRIGNVARMMAEATASAEMVVAEVAEFTSDNPWPNFWLGAAICNQEEADRDVPKLLSTPAAKRFLSIELMGAIDLPGMVYYGTESSGGIVPLREKGYPQIDWIICGGESGPGARPMHPDWARSLRDQCAMVSVPFLFKQWGEWVPRGPESLGYPLVEDVPRFLLTDAGQNGFDLGSDGGNGVWMQRAGRNIAGRLLDGVEHNGTPS